MCTALVPTPGTAIAYALLPERSDGLAREGKARGGKGGGGRRGRGWDMRGGLSCLLHNIALVYIGSYGYVCMYLPPGVMVLPITS